MKKIGVVIVNLLLFWVGASAMPGVESPNASIGYFLVGLAYGLIIISLPEVLRFFKFPRNFAGKFMLGSILTTSFFLVLHYYSDNLIVFGEGYIGRINLIFITTAKFVDLSNSVGLLIVLAVILNICSIIMEKLAKGKFK